MFAQLGHAGRISHPALLPNRAAPLAPSPVRLNKRVRLAEEIDAVTYGDPPPPRPMSTSNIKEVHEHFAAAAKRALDAGFHGVELHAGSGYLHHQFLSRSTNLRTDAYGGNRVENRARFVLETLG